jgi:hypothetical protein
MSGYPFIKLDDTSNADKVWTGVLLADRFAGDDHILLYEMGGFYIEIYLSLAWNKIVRLTLFKGTSFLEPYLDQISSEEFESLV